jgi:hypothetical protein
VATGAWVKAPVEKESDFQARIKAMAERYGWKVWHVPAPMRWDPARKSWVPAREGAGLPDLILLHDDPPRLVFLELKRKGGTLSEKQLDFLKAAKVVAEAAWAWPESDHQPPPRVFGVFAGWPDDEPVIEQMLRTKIVA